MMTAKINNEEFGIGNVDGDGRVEIVGGYDNYTILSGKNPVKIKGKCKAYKVVAMKQALHLKRYGNVYRMEISVERKVWFRTLSLGRSKETD